MRFSRNGLPQTLFHQHFLFRLDISDGRVAVSVSMQSSVVWEFRERAKVEKFGSLVIYQRSVPESGQCCLQAVGSTSIEPG
jgi:hypothetical protein